MMKKIIAMLMVAALALMGCAFAETAQDENAINALIDEGSFVVQIPVAENDEGWVADDMAQDDTVLKLYDADVIENTFVARYDPAGDGDMGVTVRHMDGDVCDRFVYWAVTVKDGAVQTFVEKARGEAPDEKALDAIVSGEWQINDNIMAGMTIAKNEGKGWSMQIATAYPSVNVFQADLFYDCELDQFVYTGGRVYQSEITNSPEVVLGEQIKDDASGSIQVVEDENGGVRLRWHNDLSPEEDALFYRPEGDGEPFAEGADSDWYMNVLADPELSEQFPYHAFVDVNGNGVPVLIVTTTESAFIGDEDHGRVYVYDAGEPKQVMEVGGGAGEKFFFNADEHTLTYYHRASGEEHIEVYALADNALTLVTKADRYAAGHGPEGGNPDGTFLQDGAAVTEAEYDALFAEYASDNQVVTYEKLG